MQKNIFKGEELFYCINSEHEGMQYKALAPKVLIVAVGNLETMDWAVYA